MGHAAEVASCSLVTCFPHQAKAVLATQKAPMVATALCLGTVLVQALGAVPAKGLGAVHIKAPKPALAATSAQKIPFVATALILVNTRTKALAAALVATAALPAPVGIVARALSAALTVA